MLLQRYVLEVVCAAALTYAAIRLSEPIARRFGLVDRPGGRKDHAVATPVTGGLALLVACVLVLPFLAAPHDDLWAFGAAGTVLIVTGMLDDLYDLPWKRRVAMQCVAALIMVYGGGPRVTHVGHLLDLGLFAVPFTVFATVGVINALNMADGVDGLAGSLALAALSMLAAAAAYSGNWGQVEHILPLIGGLLGFLALNFRFPWQPRARAFLGNSGSALIGFVIAWLSFRITHSRGHPVSGILPPWLVAPPLIDCVVLIVYRMRHGRSPFSADRNHLHHLLLDAGFRPVEIALGLSALACLMGGAAALAFLAHVPEIWLVVVFLALIAGHYALTSNRERAVRVYAALRFWRDAGVTLPAPAAPPAADA